MMPGQPFTHSRSSSLSRPRSGPPSGFDRNHASISVSIVAYETPVAELRALLGDLLRNTVRPAVTVVDNSPDDQLRPVVEQAGARYCWAGKNLGFGSGHNVAMRDAVEHSEYHLVCNPDVRLGPDVLAALKEVMDTSPEVGLVMPRVLYPDGREQRLCKRLPTPGDLLLRRFLGRPGRRLLRRSADAYELKGINLDTAREVPSLSGCFMFLRSSVLRRTGLFDPRYFMYMEDVDLCRRVGAVARTVFYPNASVVHGYAKGSYKNIKLLRYHLESAVRYFLKWGWFYDRERRLLNGRTEIWDTPSVREDVATAPTYAGTT